MVASGTRPGTWPGLGSVTGGRAQFTIRCFRANHPAGVMSRGAADRYLPCGDRRRARYGLAASRARPVAA
jgi:hypothetical protein